MPVVDIQFRISGKLIPVDHGFHLFSAVSKVIPELHYHKEVGLHPISGLFAGNRYLAITDKSFLTIRLSSERIAMVLPLSGKMIQLNGYSVRIGVPQIRAIMPSSKLYSRLVTIKGFMEPENFLEAAYRQLQYLKIKAIPTLIEQTQIAESNLDKLSGTHSTYLRRTIRIHDKEIVGFAFKVEELTTEESIRLQEKGIGGRRHLGCGIFVPINK